MDLRHDDVKGTQNKYKEKEKGKKENGGTQDMNVSNYRKIS